MGGWEGPAFSTWHGQACATGASLSAIWNRPNPVPLSSPPVPSPITSFCQLRGHLEDPASPILTVGMMGLLTSFRKAPSSSPAKDSSAILLAPHCVRPLLVRFPVSVAANTSSGNSAGNRYESGLLGSLETTGT